jgi:hypothetical protein
MNFFCCHNASLCLKSLLAIAGRREQKLSLGSPKIHIPTIRPELIEGLPVLRQAQHERHKDGRNYFLSAALTLMSDSGNVPDFSEHSSQNHEKPLDSFHWTLFLETDFCT